MKNKSTKKNSSQSNYQKYFNYWMGKGKPEKLKNAVLQHPEDTDDSGQFRDRRVWSCRSQEPPEQRSP